MTKPKTIHDKILDSHVVDVQENGACLIHVDRHLVHEVTSAKDMAMAMAMVGRLNSAGGIGHLTDVRQLWCA